MVQPTTAGNPLSAGSLAVVMASSLPKAAGQQLKNPYEAVALAVHAGMIAVGFRLVGLGEDDRTGKFWSSPSLGCLVLTPCRSAGRRAGPAAITDRVERLQLVRFPIQTLTIVNGVCHKGQ